MEEESATPSYLQENNTLPDFIDEAPVSTAPETEQVSIESTLVSAPSYVLESQERFGSLTLFSSSFTLNDTLSLSSHSTRLSELLDPFIIFKKRRSMLS